MKIHNISLASILPKKKKNSAIEQYIFHMPAEKGNGKERHYAAIPDRYKPPFCIKMKMNLSFFTDPPSQLTWIIGNGSLYFKGGYTGGADIITGDTISPDLLHFNEIPTNEYVDLTIMYGSTAMWVVVNDQCCFSSATMPYMTLLQENAVPSLYANGLDISLCVGSDTKLALETLTIVEYEDDEPGIPEDIMNIPELSPFEWYVKGLPPALQEEMMQTDAFLMGDMKNVLKCKRTIDKYGHLTYNSPCGFQYTVFDHGARELHEINWDYMKKPDYTDAILHHLAKSSPDFAQKLFSRLWDCPSPTCKRISNNEHNGQQKIACRSTIVFRWLAEEFEDVRRVAGAACEVVKAAKGGK